MNSKFTIVNEAIRESEWKLVIEWMVLNHPSYRYIEGAVEGTRIEDKDKVLFHQVVGVPTMKPNFKTGHIINESPRIECVAPVHRKFFGRVVDTEYAFGLNRVIVFRDGNPVMNCLSDMGVFDPKSQLAPLTIDPVRRIDSNYVVGYHYLSEGEGFTIGRGCIRIPFTTEEARITMEADAPCSLSLWISSIGDAEISSVQLMANNLATSLVSKFPAVKDAHWRVEQSGFRSAMNVVLRVRVKSDVLSVAYSLSDEQLATGDVAGIMKTTLTMMFNEVCTKLQASELLKVRDVFDNLHDVTVKATTDFVAYEDVSLRIVEAQVKMEDKMKDLLLVKAKADTDEKFFRKYEQQVRT